MISSIPPTSNRIGTRLAALAALTLAGFALAGCETTGPGPAAEAVKLPDPPMTHQRAATECWMSTEKSSAGKDLDKRADYVTKCIDQKMKAAAAAPKT